MSDEKAMKDLVLGDVVVADEGPLGASVRVGNDRKVWFNAAGELELIRWLAVKRGAIKDKHNNARDRRYVMDEQKTELKKEIPRARLPWAEITDAERVQRLREVIKCDQASVAALRREVAELRDILMRHRHGSDNELLVPAERRCFGPHEPAQGCVQGQERF